MNRIFAEISARSEASSEVGEKLLAQGQAIVYQVESNPNKPIVKAYPDGRLVIVRVEQGEAIEGEPYQ